MSLSTVNFLEFQVMINAERHPDHENAADLQEVVYDIIGRQLTREYIDVIKLILFTTSTNFSCDDAATGMDDEMEVSEINSNTGNVINLNIFLKLFFLYNCFFSFR